MKTGLLHTAAALVLAVGATGVAAAPAYVRGVPYFNQGLNSIEPAGSCQNTCMAMALAWYGADGVTPDAISGRWGTSVAQSVGGWQQVFNTEAEERGLRVRDTGMSEGWLSQVYAQLDRGIPVVVHGRFSQSGHLIVLLGYDDRYFYVHDPGRDWTGYGSGPTAGRHARYPRESVESVIADLSTGYVRFHALDPQAVGPRAAWESAWPDSVIAGREIELELAVRVPAGEGTAEARVTADLSALGGPAEAALAAAGGDRYRLARNLPGEGLAPGRRAIEVSVAAAGEASVPVLRHEVTLLAPVDRVVYDGAAPGAPEAWSALGAEVDLTAADPAGGNGTVLAVDAHPVETGGTPPRLFTAVRVLDPPLDPAAYGSLRFAFHPGEVTPAEGDFLVVYVNDDARALHWLLGGETPGVRFDQRRWQTVEVPMADLGFTEEPIGSLLLAGSVEGRLYVDDVRWVAAAPCPLAARWSDPPVEVAVAGEGVELRGTVCVERRDAAGAEPRLVADLSAVGGAQATPLVAAGDGEYRLQARVTPGPGNGYRDLVVRVSQEAGERQHERLLIHRLRLLPRRGLTLYDDGLAPGWSLSPSFNVTVDAAAADEVHAGGAAMRLEARGFTVDLLAGTPIDPVGYRALCFWFHPGEVAVGRSAPALSVFVNGDARTAVRLLGEDAAVPGLDLERREWQRVEVPMSAFGLFEGPITGLRLLGNFQGVFYLDDMGLEAEEPPPATTAVAAESVVRPGATVLQPAYPNPFNSATTLRFELASAGLVELAVYDVLGQRVRWLGRGLRSAGGHAVSWDGRGDDGRPAASGVYVVRLQAGPRAETRRLLLLR